MERLLAYEGPVVHVDHAHRAPAWTAGKRECEEKREYDRKLLEQRNELQDYYKGQSSWKDKRIEELQAQVVAKDDERVKSRKMYKAHIQKLMDETIEDEAAKREMEQQIQELKADIERRNEADASRSVSIDNYYRETTELKLKVQELEERNRKLEAENEALQQQLLSEHDKLMQFRDDLKQARNDVENARASEGRMKSAIRQLEESKDVLKSEKATLIQSWNQLNKEKEALEAKLAGL